MLYISYQLPNQAIQQHHFPLDIQQTAYSFDESSILPFTLDCQWINERLNISIHLKKGISTLTLHQCRLQIPYSFLPTYRLLCNGYQSWTETKEYLPDEKVQTLKKMVYPIMKQFGDYGFFQADHPQNKHSWTYAAIRDTAKNKDKEIYFLASLNEHTGFTIIQFDTRNNLIFIDKDCKNLQITNSYFAFDLLLKKGNEKALFQAYFQQLNRPKPKHPATAGWTSWYHYYTNISEQIILENLQAFSKRKMPISIFQIDDGWQHKVGDWLIHNRKFPRGLRFLTHSIQQKGYKAGLWLAPLICQHQSIIYQKHPDWLLKDVNGKPVKGGYNALWKSHMYPLNFYHIEVQNYLQKVFEHILNYWQFDMVKLDFLYAAILQPPPHKTRGEMMHDIMRWLRKVIGDKIILGCGVPLSAAFGTTDYCRIGADVHLGWEMGVLKKLGNRERVSTILALRNAIYRRQLNGRAFINDPDVSILRNSKNWLTPTQRYTLFLINQLFGSLQFVSDNINHYDAETMRLYVSQFPIKNKNISTVINQNELYTVHFSVGALQYTAYCNLTPQATIINPKKHFPSQIYLFNGKAKQFIGINEQLHLAPYESICLLHIDEEKEVEIIGSDHHLFAGSEVDVLEEKIEGHFHLFTGNFTQKNIHIYIKINNSTEFIFINQKKYLSKLLASHLRGIIVDF